MSTGRRETIDMDALLNRAVSPEQQRRLDAYDRPLRDRLYGRIRQGLLTSVRLQVEYCSATGINAVALERLIQAELEQWGREQQYQNHLRELVQAGATFAMLYSLHGLSRRDFDVIRQELGLPGDNGSRCRKPVADTESARIYRHWESQGKPEDTEGLLELHRLSQQPLCLLWGLVQDWVHILSQMEASRRPGRRQ